MNGVRSLAQRGSLKGERHCVTTERGELLERQPWVGQPRVVRDVAVTPALCAGA